MGDGTVSALLPDNIVENKQQGERFVFRADRNDAVCAFDFIVSPKGGMPMLHCHAKQSEIFRCKSGRLTVLGKNKSERAIGPGEELRLGPGEMHAFVNRGDVDVVCEVEYRPAGRNEQWLKVVNAPVALEGRAPTLLDLGPFIGDVDMFIDGPPVFVQRALYAVLRVLGTALGKKKQMLDAASRVYGKPITW